MMEGKTTLSVVIDYYDGTKTTFELSRNAWDLDGYQMGELFRQLLASMGFAEKTIGEVFGDEEELYEDMASLRTTAPDFDPDEARLETCSTCDEDCCKPRSETLAKVFADMEDPCWMCEEECADTACLLEPEELQLDLEWHKGDGDVE
jgi:hypothetical protein